MTKKNVSRVSAALLTPRRPDGSVDVTALGRLVRFLLSKGISSFAVNGATGEFCLTMPDELGIMLATVKEAGGDAAQILCGIGAPGSARAVELASIAQEHGVVTLLLPMPHFFPYQQEDLDLFCRVVAAATELPILLYNLPQFTSGLKSGTVRTLITEVPNIIGIKDSSGSLDILRDLTRHGVEACRIVGSDGVLPAAITEGICDGVISGIACVVPELLLGFYRDTPLEPVEFERNSRLLHEVVAQLSKFPTPWGLKWIAEARGIVNATFSQPVTAHRREQSEQMFSWFRSWHGHSLYA